MILTFDFSLLIMALFSFYLLQKEASGLQVASLAFDLSFDAKQTSSGSLPYLAGG